MTVTATCGHTVDIQNNLDSPFLEARLARHRNRACQKCRIEAELARQDAERTRPQRITSKTFPPGTLIAMRREDDGTWKGTIDCEGQSAVARDSDIIALVRSMLGQAKRWRRRGLIAGSTPLVTPSPTDREKSRSIIQRRLARRGLPPLGGDRESEPNQRAD